MLFWGKNVPAISGHPVYAGEMLHKCLFFGFIVVMPRSVISDRIEASWHHWFIAKLLMQGETKLCAVLVTALTLVLQISVCLFVLLLIF
jgi:hypothetical protein